MSRAVSIGRTSLYIKPNIQEAKDRQAIQELKSAHSQHPLYGVRRLAIQLGWSENKTRRIRKLADVNATRPPKKYQSYKGKPEINPPANHLQTYASLKDTSRPQDGMDYSLMTHKANAWVQDFTYLRIRSGLFYLALVMNLSTREILSWKLGTSHSSSLTHIALIIALRDNPSPAILHSDRGSEYLSQRHQDTCQRFEITLSASKPGKPWQNGFMERCIKTIKEELGPLTNYHDADELYIGIANAIHYYNHKRIHTALRMSPVAYATRLKPKSKFRLKHRDMVFGKKVA